MQKWRDPMHTSTGLRSAICVGCAVGVFGFCARARADEVTLQSGATIRGHVSELQLPDHSKAVEIRASSGALVVLERDSVKQIKRGASAGPKPAQAANKPRLTAKEQAWMAKVRGLVSRFSSGDASQRRRAADELLKIRDPDALPAQTRYLQQNSDEDLRRIYVSILREMPGSNTVYYLVGQSLFDSSAQIRQLAREAIGSERADSARTLYIFALKLRDANLATRAALGIQEVGDPNGDAIPYLIEALVHEGERAIILPKTEWGEATDWQALFITKSNMRIIREHPGIMGLYDNPPIYASGTIPVVKNPPPATPQVTTQLPIVPFNVPVISIVHENDGNQTALEALLSHKPATGLRLQPRQMAELVGQRESQPGPAKTPG
jgi:hypothetical protein